MHHNANVMSLYKKYIENVMPDRPDGTLHPWNLKFSTEPVPQFSYCNALHVLAVGHVLLKSRGELPGDHMLADSVVFARGDGVVDGWTKVYHLSLLVSEVSHPRRPGSCLDYLVGDINEGNPIEWGVVHLKVRPPLDQIRQHVADMLNVGDGAYLMAIARGFTHAENQWLSAFNQPGEMFRLSDLRICAPTGSWSAQAVPTLYSCFRTNT